MSRRRPERPGRPVQAGPQAPTAPSAAGRDPDASRRVVEGRLGALSVRAGMTVGGWIGFALGLVLGAVLGALLCWFADAVLQWQHDLGVTLGVAQNLLPFGDQAAILRTISREWYLVIPIVAFAGGLIWAIVGALVAGIVTVGYNLASRRVRVVVEFEQAADADASPPIASIARIRALPGGEPARGPEPAEPADGVGPADARDARDSAEPRDAAESVDTAVVATAATAASIPAEGAGSISGANSNANADAVATAPITSRERGSPRS